MLQIRNKQVNILNDTLHICENGSYMYGEAYVKLKLKPTEMEEAVVFLPEQMGALVDEMDFSALCSEQECVISCENIDSFAKAAKRNKQSQDLFGQGVLVLNFANAVNPGGGVRRGARAQEEDLCRTSTLLLSLESAAAKPYYRYNSSLQTDLGSDAVILTPAVEVIKNRAGELLEQTLTVSVVSCAAPMLTFGLEGLSAQQYETLFYNRIVRILKFAACQGYKSLVLGAFGCGEFGNDAALVSALFYRAFQELGIYAQNRCKLFRTIDFAVLDCSEDQYNFKQFARKFCRSGEW